MIVEHEQHGSERALYGQESMKLLAENLTLEFGRGFSLSNLKLMRQFYFTWKARPLAITQARPGKSKAAQKSQTVSGQLAPTFLPSRFELSWSHYVLLMSIENTDERKLSRKNPSTNCADFTAANKIGTAFLNLCNRCNLWMSCLASRLASQYSLYLPSKKDLQKRLMQWTAEQEAGR